MTASTSAASAALAPVASLDEIERQFAAGNYVESSRLLWEATQETFLMLGAAHGLNTGDVRAIAYALDEKYGLEHHYLGRLIAGRMMRDHAEMEALERHELEIPHCRLPEFIRRSYGEFGSDDTLRSS